jgi:hypothetical protein
MEGKVGRIGVKVKVELQLPPGLASRTEGLTG